VPKFWAEKKPRVGIKFGKKLLIFIYSKAFQFVHLWKNCFIPKNNTKYPSNMFAVILHGIFLWNNLLFTFIDLADIKFIVKQCISIKINKIIHFCYVHWGFPLYCQNKYSIVHIYVIPLLKYATAHLIILLITQFRPKNPIFS